MDQYLAAKNKLFRSLSPSKRKKIHSHPKTAVVNADSPWLKKIVEGCPANMITYSIDADADLKAENIVLSPVGTEMTINFKGKKLDLKWPLVGRFNVYNCLATIGVGLTRNIPLEKIIPILENAPSTAGRLEMVPNPLGLKIYVDFAHTEDALLNVLECLKEFKKGRIITVFGCGGNRDTTKRPKMAKVCQDHSDLTIVTSDNPRNEDPADIIRQILAGFSDKNSYVVEMDRYNAIDKAISLAHPDDIILIAGKGHETHQIFAYKTVAFDDRKTALEICHKKTKTSSVLTN
jgi:UDP-N-acetylmuramoyl-L-alanyl-D-glutamate--2,6-diaminopimelate ligase